MEKCVDRHKNIHHKSIATRASPQKIPTRVSPQGCRDLWPVRVLRKRPLGRNLESQILKSQNKYGNELNLFLLGVETKERSQSAPPVLIRRPISSNCSCDYLCDSPVSSTVDQSQTDWNLNRIEIKLKSSWNQIKTQSKPNRNQIEIQIETKLKSNRTSIETSLEAQSPWILPKVCFCDLTRSLRSGKIVSSPFFHFLCLNFRMVPKYYLVNSHSNTSMNSTNRTSRFTVPQNLFPVHYQIN